jgi:hypothetical protein
MPPVVGEHLGRGYADFFLLLKEEWRLVAQETLEE